MNCFFIKHLHNLSMASSSPSPTFKVCLIGDSGVGKSMLLQSLKEGGVEVPDDKTPKTTVGLDICYHQMEARGKTFSLQLWDTAGSERYNCLTQSYIRNVKLVFLVYDITSQKSFDSIPKWFDAVNEGNPDSLYYLVGNKTDLAEQRAILQNTAYSYAKANGWDYFEISALMGLNVLFLFDQIGKELVFKFSDEFDQSINVNNLNSSLELSDPLPQRQKQRCWSIIIPWRTSL